MRNKIHYFNNLTNLKIEIVKYEMTLNVSATDLKQICSFVDNNLDQQLDLSDASDAGTKACQKLD